MSLKAFHAIPRNLREWSQWMEQQELRPRTQSPSVAEALTIDYKSGTCVSLTLTKTVSSISISNPPPTGIRGELCLLITQDSVPRTITWPASFKWAGGTAPTLSTMEGDIDIIEAWTIDGGTTWYASASLDWS